MRLATLTTISLLALAACGPDYTSSQPEAGMRETTLDPSWQSALPRAAVVPAQPVAEPDVAATIAADTAAALAVAPAPESEASEDDGTLSDEQSFAAVSARETIQSDAARIAENRAQYVVIQPTDLPPRPDGSGASIVAYALATTNNPGQPLYHRSSFMAQSRFERACAKYGASDRAQEAFLDAGGPERDRYGMDPDGDGFACYWDPRPFRAARAGAPVVPETYEVIETPGES